MSNRSKLIKIADVPTWFDDNYGLEITRQTVYNWIKNGKRGVTLRSMKKMGQAYCNERWLHEFASNL